MSNVYHEFIVSQEVDKKFPWVLRVYTDNIPEETFGFSDTAEDARRDAIAAFNEKNIGV